MVTEQAPTQKKVRQRSPSYPALDLEAAIARARVLWEKDRFNSTAVDVVLGHWGYAPGSSNGLVTLAALIKFGLVADEGSGERRKARLTELARRIILDDRPSSPEREAAIREAALNPTIHMDLWDQYKGALPSDDNLRYELRVNRAFTDSAVVAFIKELHTTWAFAKLTESVSMSGDGEDKASSGSEQKMDTVSQTAILEKEERPKAQTPTSSSVKYSWPLSKNVLAELTITGADIGPKDLEMLRKYLELAKDALEDHQ